MQKYNLYLGIPYRQLDTGKINALVICHLKNITIEYTKKKKWELSELCTLIFILIYRVNIIFMSGN